MLPDPFVFIETTPMNTTFQNQPVIELQDAASRVLIAPQYGARLLTWTIDEDPILYWPKETDWATPQSVAGTRGGNPILFPFIARHYVDGVLAKWRDASGTVRDMPMHGFARNLPFEVVEQNTRVLRMRLQPNDETKAIYPFDFSFDVAYELTGATLISTLETTNTGGTPLPYYAGHHFYFAIPHNTRNEWQIDLPCKTWGSQNSDGSVNFYEAESTSTTLDDPRLVDRFHLNFTQPGIRLQNAQTGALRRVEWEPEYSPLWYDVTTWTQSSESNFYCIEPWLGLPNAIHHGHGLRWLQPGRKETAVCRIGGVTS